MLKCVVLDFDDTIVMSETLKRQLWYDMVDDKHHQEVSEVYASKPFKDRYDLAEYFSEISGVAKNTLLGQYDAALDKFFTSQKGVVNGVIPFFDHLSGMGNPEEGGVGIYINSATPAEFLGKAVEQTGIAHYFRGIYGNPHLKAEHLRRAMADCGATPDETVMIGDSLSDMQGAGDVGCHFIGVDFDDSGKLNGTGCLLIRDYGEMLLYILQKFNAK